MSTEALTLYKLIVLYMLNKVNFPLTNAQISEFVLGREYTTYFTLQEAVLDLEEANFIQIKTIRNTSYCHITHEGKETLGFFDNKISDSIKEDIDNYLSENKYELRDEVSNLADFYKSTSGEFTVHCQVKEGKNTLIELNLSVPSEEQAEIMCQKWKNSSQDIYSYIMKTLM